jgi:RNA polymerase sigma-70 factor (ECF subfamily)
LGTPETDAEINELFVKYTKSDSEAFSRLYDLSSPKVWGFIVKRVPNRALAEEIFQEAWAKIHRTKESYDPKFPALPWIFTVTRSVWIDALRRQRNRPETPVESETLEREAAQGGASVTSLGEAPTWDEIAPMLPAQERELLEDRYLKEWSFEEIGKKLNLSEAGVRQRISRILRKIRSQTL